MTDNASQAPAAAAVVITSTLRPSLLAAVRSVFRQVLDGRIHVLIGVDVAQGERSVLDVIRAEVPPHVMLTVIDLGYSTASRNGGMHPNMFGGSLPALASYAANSRYVAYLDDDDWWARNHLAALLQAIGGRQWAFAPRWLVDPHTLWPICPDEWDAVGPGRGINQARFGGFVAPSGLMLDKLACPAALPLWAQAAFPDGGGNDRLVFDLLSRHFTWAESAARSVFYVLNPASLRHEHHAAEFRQRNIQWVEDRAQVARIEAGLAAAAQALQDGSIDAAAEQCRGVLALHPYCAAALQLLARVEHARGDSAAAQRHRAAAIAIDDRDPAGSGLPAPLRQGAAC